MALERRFQFSASRLKCGASTAKAHVCCDFRGTETRRRTLVANGLAERAGFELSIWISVGSSKKPADGQPGKVETVQSYQLAPGMAHLYGEGGLHSPRRDADTD